MEPTNETERNNQANSGHAIQESVQESSEEISGQGMHIKPSESSPEGTGTATLESVAGEKGTPEKSGDIQQSSQEEANWKKFREQRAHEKAALQRSQENERKSQQESALLKKALTEVIDNGQLGSDDTEESEDARIKRLVDASLKERDANEFPTKLRQIYSDFDSVCSAEAIEYLEFKEPELALALRYMPEGLEKYSTLYKAVKKRVPSGGKKEKHMMEANANKPRATSIPGTTQLGTEANIGFLSESRKAENWKRMQQIQNGHI